MEKDFDKMHNLFEASLPELTDDLQFLRRVENGIDAIEIVASRKKDYRIRSRINALLSALAGFISGVVFTLIYPFIRGAINSILLSFLHIEVSLDIISMTLSFLAIGLVCVTVSLGTFSLLNTVPRNWKLHSRQVS